MTKSNDNLRITEALDLDLDKERWICNRCGHDLGPAGDNYKNGCKVHERNPTEIHDPKIAGEYTFSPDPDWVRIIEFYCPSCAVQVETEYLPPGHPITHDIELDIRSLKQRIENGEVVIVEGRIRYPDKQGDDA